MTRWSVLALMLAGSLLLALPPGASARSSSRSGFIVSESLRRQHNGLPPRYTPSTPKSYKYQGNIYVTPRGSVLHRYTYKSPSGRTSKGTIQSLPGGSYQHKGSWR